MRDYYVAYRRVCEETSVSIVRQKQAGEAKLGAKEHRRHLTISASGPRPQQCGLARGNFGGYDVVDKRFYNYCIIRTDSIILEYKMNLKPNNNK